MAEPIRCDNCGALMGDEDLFCGECGAPRPPSEPPPRPSEPGATVAPAAPPPRHPKAVAPSPRPPRSAGTSAARRPVALVVIGLLLAIALALCILGLIVAFFIPQSEVGRAGTPDMILGSTIICFCPGAMLLIAAIVLWLVAIRRR